MKVSPDTLRRLVIEMRRAYGQGENVMARARAMLGEAVNLPEATLIAYDLQAGNYVARASRDPEANARWCRQLAQQVGAGWTAGSSLLEVGVGEATTLAGVVQALDAAPGAVAGLDLSWSRCAVGREWLARQQVRAELMVGDLFAIPLPDESADVVYTSHSLEPNGGREEAALRELLRVTRRRLVLCEPLYELASPEARQRMELHGYVRRLVETLNGLGARVTEHRLMEYSPNPLNPSGVIVVEKTPGTDRPPEPALEPRPLPLRCPLTHTPLVREPDLCLSPSTGIAYPVLRNIPLLRAEHAVIASKLLNKPEGNAAPAL